MNRREFLKNTSAAALAVVAPAIVRADSLTNVIPLEPRILRGEIGIFESFRFVEQVTINGESEFFADSDKIFEDFKKELQSVQNFYWK